MRNIENWRKWCIENKEKLRKQKTTWANSANGKASAKRWRDKSPKALYSLYIHSAERRGILFDISLDVFTEHINKDCYYCGQSAIPKRNGIDRIDNSKGYVSDNIVPCCFRCNQLKGKLSVNDFYNHIIKILEYAVK